MMVRKINTTSYHFRYKNKETIKGSVYSLESVEIGGIKQWILIRGQDMRNPLLLFLHGGPGAAQISFAPLFQAELEKHFTVVNWDQRGSGKSYSGKVPEESMNIEQFAKDTCELVQLLLKRFGQKKLYLAAHSWGSIFGLLAVQRCPELFHAYIGIGQAVDMRETAKILCRYNYNAARKAKNKKAIKELGGIGYTYIPTKKSSFDALLQIKWLYKLGGLFGKPDFRKNIVKQILFSREYTLIDKLKYKSGTLFSFKSVFNELMEVNLFKSIPEVKVPVYFCAGFHDYNTPYSLTEKYYNFIKAPYKKLFWFCDSGHAPHFEEPERFASIIINKVLNRA